jgi:hypothetical protein
VFGVLSGSQQQSRTACCLAFSSNTTALLGLDGEQQAMFPQVESRLQVDPDVSLRTKYTFSVPSHFLHSIS